MIFETIRNTHEWFRATSGTRANHLLRQGLCARKRLEAAETRSHMPFASVAEVCAEQEKCLQALRYICRIKVNSFATVQLSVLQDRLVTFAPIARSAGFTLEDFEDTFEMDYEYFQEILQISDFDADADGLRLAQRVQRAYGTEPVTYASSGIVPDTAISRDGLLSSLRSSPVPAGIVSADVLGQLITKTIAGSASLAALESSVSLRRGQGQFQSRLLPSNAGRSLSSSSSRLRQPPTAQSLFGPLAAGATVLGAATSAASILATPPLPQLAHQLLIPTALPAMPVARHEASANVGRYSRRLALPTTGPAMGLIGNGEGLGGVEEEDDSDGCRSQASEDDDSDVIGMEWEA